MGARAIGPVEVVRVHQEGHHLEPVFRERGGVILGFRLGGSFRLIGHQYI